VLRLASGVFSVAQKPAPLAQMIQRPAQHIPVFAASQIELFGQRPKPVPIGIPVRSILCTLPTDGLVGHMINYLMPPRIQLLPRKRRTEIVLHQHPQQRYLAQPTPEIVPAQGTGIGTVLYGRPFVILLASDALLENIHSTVEQRASLFGHLHERPTERVGAHIYSQSFFHKDFVFGKNKNFIWYFRLIHLYLQCKNFYILPQ